MVAGPDVDRDGILEILVTEGVRGEVRCISGATSAIIWEWRSANRWGGQSASSVPDITGDGVAEVVIGASTDSEFSPHAGRVYLVNGLTGLTIREHVGLSNANSWSGEQLGFSVFGIEDMDGDGKGDYLAAAPFSDRQGSLPDYSGTVTCWSGATGSLLWIQNGQPEELFGLSIAPGPDLTGDLRPEILVGAPARSYATRPQGLVYILDGSSGAILSEVLGSTYMTGTRPFGSSLALLDDIDLDGYEDFFVGAPYATPGSGVPYAGEGFVISGASQALLWALAGWKDLQRLGTKAAACGDLDEDGIEDVAISAEQEPLTPGGYEGRVYLHSGATGEQLAILQNPGTQWQGLFGISLLKHEIPGRPEPLLLIGEFYGGRNVLSATGLVWPWTFEPFLRADVHTISATAGGDVRLRLNFPQTDAGQPYALLVSGSGTGPTLLGGAEVPLTRDAWFTRSVQGNLPPLLHNPRGALDAEGNAWCGLRAPPGALGAQVGRTLYFAAVTGTSGAVAHSSIAVRVRVVM